MILPPLISLPCRYAFGYETQRVWENAREPFVFNEIEAFYKMHPQFIWIHRLAQARILQSLLDLSGKDKSIRNKAFSWMFSDTSDFHAWCSDAGYSPKIVKHKAKDIIQNGLTWRLAAGDGPRYEARKKTRRAA